MINSNTGEDVTPQVRVIQLGEEKFVSLTSLQAMIDLVGTTEEASRELNDWTDAEALLLTWQAIDTALPGDATIEDAGTRRVHTMAALETDVDVLYHRRPLPAGFLQPGQEVPY